MANIKRNLIYSVVLSLTQVAVPLLTIPYITRTLSPAGIGRINFIDSFAFYFVTLAEIGVMVYGIREVSKLRDNTVALGKLVSELLVLRLLGCLIIAIPFAAAIMLSWDKIADPALAAGAVVFYLINAIALDWYFIGLERFGFIAVRNIVIRLLAIAAIFLLITRQEDYYRYYWIMVTASAFVCLWNFRVVWKEVKLSFSHLQIRRHLKFLWVTYAINIFYSIPLMLDNVLLRFVSTPAVVALYALPVKMIRLGTSMITDSLLVFFPRIVLLSNTQQALEAKNGLRLSLQVVTLLSVPFGLGTFLLADHLAVVLFGEAYYAAGDCFRILSIFPALKCLSLFLSNSILIAHHHERRFLWNLIFSSLLFIALAIIFSYYQAAPGMCAALVASELVLIVLNYITVRRQVPHLSLYRMNFLYHALLGATLMLVVILAVQRTGVSGIPLLIVAGLLGITVYGSSLFWISRNEVTVLAFGYFRKQLGMAVTKPDRQ